ncbi:tyrosine-type recombinase/integrase [Aquibacillus sp. 3ASR75-54]|uniref:Tyrosine-type recombinase/integrase n=1 Tax=Aquibacillus salsiterrae TaxID=2950439 RepID=A0A9X3WJ47_9BACI|nr:tyrosine-type recombinase/integrase [Aquibacillus salsiterrae]
MDVSDQLPAVSRYPTYTLIYPVLMRLLYSCGLRISEALSLKCQDVDLTKGILFIEKSKKGKSRIVPMSQSMTEFCRDYAKRMSFNANSDGYFFPAPNGGKYSRHSVRSTIQNMYAKAGISKLPSGSYPRVHDIRHTQAVHALEKMQSEGMDLYYSLPILCSYLGHKDIRSTEKYLRLPYFKHDEVALSSRELVQGMIPEVNWDEK